ncbi:MAG TPA: hypothetical protein VI819_05465 [Patescibacteria group bacterium]|nr:hypothetical protein [Patescibacteria group bacterium]
MSEDTEQQSGLGTRFNEKGEIINRGETATEKRYTEEDVVGLAKGYLLDMKDWTEEHKTGDIQVYDNLINKIDEGNLDRRSIQVFGILGATQELSVQHAKAFAESIYSGKSDSVNRIEEIKDKTNEITEAIKRDYPVPQAEVIEGK